MNVVELLAPAKNLETAIAAINCGADAIYIGASDFGARKNASNNLEDIKSLVDYAHKFYVRVHVVINTILKDEELDSVIALINKLYEIGVDAIIVQDMAILNFAIMGKLPPIQIHASTQCNNRTFEKVKFFDNVGVSRVILARELSVKSIKDICQNTDCEIETFIHGALCVSYSGQCYLSYFNGGRSANRGECAQPCRKKYSLIDKDGKYYHKNKYLLSLKDFNAQHEIRELVASGVKSFKIEGRLKDANYVKNVVAFYNTELNKFADRTSSGKIFLDFEPNVNKTFNRGYTNYFLKGREHCFNFFSPKACGEKLGKVKRICRNYFEVDFKLNPQDGICFIKGGTTVGFLVNKVEGNKIYPNKMDGIKTGTLLYRNFNSKFEKQLNNTKTTRKIGLNISINANMIVLTDEDGNSISQKLPNGKVPKDVKKTVITFVNQIKKTGNSDFYIQNIEVNSSDFPFLPISQINEFRRHLFSELMNERLKNYPKFEQKPLRYFDYISKTIDYRGNVYNKAAREFYKNCSCEVVEMALESNQKIKSGIELMRTKHCLKFASDLCGKSCPRLFLIDDRGTKYPLKFDCKNCEMVILSPDTYI